MTSRCGTSVGDGNSGGYIVVTINIITIVSGYVNGCVAEALEGKWREVCILRVKYDLCVKCL